MVRWSHANDELLFNSTLRRITPKYLHSVRKVIEIVAYVATGLFNEGLSAALGTMQLLDIKMQNFNRSDEHATNKKRKHVVLII